MTKNGYIYKLCIKDGSIDDCYIGSTTNPRVRKSSHKSTYNAGDKVPLHKMYTFISEHGTFENWVLHILEKIEFNDKIQLLQKEREWIEHIKPSLNKYIPTITYREWADDNKEKIQAKNKYLYNIKKEYNQNRVCDA